MAKVYLLVGNIGSGKSTWSEDKIRTEKYIAEKEETSKWPSYINQDILGSRQKCLKLAEIALEIGNDIIVDRTNISKKQRSYWINLAKKHKAEIHCIEFKIKPEECLKRVLNRKDHPTIKNMSEDKIKSIIKKFEDEYEEPKISEGFTSFVVICDVLPDINIPYILSG